MAAPKTECGRFSEALAQLQSVHDYQVVALTAEVSRLRAELEGHRAAAAASPRCSKGTASECPGDSGTSEALAVSEQWLSPSSEGSGQLNRPSHAMRLSGKRHSTTISSGIESTLRVSRNRKAIREAPHQKGCRGWWLREQQSFDVFMGLVIAINAVFIGIESSMARAGQEPPTAFNAMEYCFVAVYIAELTTRLAVKGIKELTNRWIQFDLFLVICGIFDVATKLVTADSIGALEKVLLVRILRLARLARVFRMMTKFNTLWLLVNGLMNSFSAQVWTSVMTCTLIYIFSVLGLELLPDPQAGEEYTRIVNTHFGSLLTAALTLLQGLTLDSFAAIYTPIMLEKPYLAAYFIPFLLIVPIALMNLVTAIMVNLSLEQADRDKQAHEDMQRERREALASLLTDMFRDLDANGSGRVDMAELMNAPDELHSLIFEIVEVRTKGADTRWHDLQDIFDTLDIDNSGDVEIKEFCDGLTKMHNRDALDRMRLQKKCQTMLDKVTNLVTNRSKESLQASNSGIQFV